MAAKKKAQEKEIIDEVVATAETTKEIIALSKDLSVDEAVALTKKRADTNLEIRDKLDRQTRIGIEITKHKHAIADEEKRYLISEPTQDSLDKVENLKLQITELERQLVVNTDKLKEYETQVEEINKALTESARGKIRKLLEVKAQLEYDRFAIIEKELFEVVNKVMESETSFADRERVILEELTQVRMYAPELATLLESDIEAVKDKLGLEKAKLQNVTRRELVSKAREMKIHFDRKMR